MSCCGLRFHRGLYGAQLPAREGVSNVFQAAKQCGVGKIVLTSSVAAVTDSPVNGHVYTEEDWNTASTIATGVRFTPTPTQFETQQE